MYTWGSGRDFYPEDFDDKTELIGVDSPGVLDILYDSPSLESPLPIPEREKNEMVHRLWDI